MIFQNTEIISVPDIYLDVLTGCYTSKQLDNDSCKYMDLTGVFM